MPTCQGCGHTYVSGEPICSECGDDIDLPCASSPVLPRALAVAGVEHGLVYEVPTIAFHVIEIQGTCFNEGVISVQMPLSRLEVPIRVGRRDTQKFPPIHPELDLSDLLSDYGKQGRSPISRLHCAIQLQDGQPAVKHLVAHSTSTWIRHTRSTRLLPVPTNGIRQLMERDVIVLGLTKGERVHIRIRLNPADR